MLMSPVLLPYLITLVAQPAGTPNTSSSEVPQLTSSYVITDLILHLGYTALAIAILMRFHEIKLNDVIGHRNGRLSRIFPLSMASGVLFVVFVFMYFFWYDLVTNITSGSGPETQDVVIELKKATDQADPLTLLILIALPVIRAPIVEEFFFRGLLYPAIKATGHPKLALITTALLFAVIHDNTRAFIPLVILSFLLTWQYERSGNLISPILTHATFNLINSLLIVLVEFPPNA